MRDKSKPVAHELKPMPARAAKVRKAAAGVALVGAVGALTVKAYLQKRVSTEEPEICRLAVSLQKHVGREVTVLLAGVDAQILERWSEGTEDPDPVVLGRLRSADQAVGYIVKAYGDETAKAWLFGMNRWLNDEAPASVLRHGSQPESWKGVVEAAQAFVEL
jgi:hypothetical protein